MKKFLVAGLVAAACSAQAVELYNNGAVVDGSGLSILNSPTDTTLGAGSNASAILADNFSVGGLGWDVASLDFFGYQTSAVGFTFTNVTWSLRLGSDVNTATVVASGTTAVTNGGLVGYRVTPTTLTNTTRAIYRVSADIPDITLAAGSYFATWSLAGTGVSGPFVPPVNASVGTGNALQSLPPAAFVTLAMGTSLVGYDVPFAVQGTVVAVPEPTSLALMLAGGLAVAGIARRRRAV